MHFAHTRGLSPSDWEPLDVHLNDVAGGNDTHDGASVFAEALGAGAWGRLVGLWHDLGKYSREFQEYLLQSATGGAGGTSTSRGRVDHSTAGAQHAARFLSGLPGYILAYCVAGHHGGLPDFTDPAGGTAGLHARLARTDLPDYSAAPQRLLAQPPLPKLGLSLLPDTVRKSFQVSVFCRMLYSCLVDADYLATEGFMRPDTAARRGGDLSTPANLLPHLDEYLKTLGAQACRTSVNQARAGVLAQCRAAAPLPPGFFSLTVPTGGGKTLSSLAFALRHALQHGLRRVIYAIPFTSIIEQNAAVFRTALRGAGARAVLEHHSNFEPRAAAESMEGEAQTPWARLASENWDAPLIVTTNVQLFESLFASKPSRCRKLHNIARSVLILDECQTLPVTLLAPTLQMLAELARNYGCTVVLCSATQPAIQQRDGFPIGLTGVREIIADPPRLYEMLRRVDVRQLGKLDDADVVAQLSRHEQVLCIVNTRAHAARLFAALREVVADPTGLFHLSTLMCPRHRSAVLRLIRQRLQHGVACRVVSTQLIEAGVDVDFPVVYRALTGLDSVAQAAGRCNREGCRPRGTVFVFDTDVQPRGDLCLRRQLGGEVAGLHADLLSLEAVEHFFELLYWQRRQDWDHEEILRKFLVSGREPHFQFREAAQTYRLIPDLQQPVLVPYGRGGRALIEELCRMPEPPGRDFDRRAQRYAVGLYDRQFEALRENQSVAQYHERFWVLENARGYDGHLGLTTDVAGFDPERLQV